MFPLPLLVTVTPSRRLRLGILVLLAIAMAAAWLAQLSTPWQTLLSLALVASAWRHLKQGKAVTLRCDKAGRLSVNTDGKWSPLELVHPQILLPTVTLLRYRPAGNNWSKSLLVLPDGLPQEDYRRLRVWLRWMAKPGNDVSPAPSGR